MVKPPARLWKGPPGSGKPARPFVPPKPIPVYPGNWDTPTKPASGFRQPYYFATRAELLRMPESPAIEISLQALVKMYFYVHHIGLEVGWLGTVNELVPGSAYVIDDVFLFDQTVSAGHMDITSEVMYEFVSSLAGQPNEDYIFNNTKFWGHSHVEGGVYPSPQDNLQMDMFGDIGATYFVRGILNRRGDINFSLYDWRAGIAYHNVEWAVEEGEPERDWLKEQYRLILEEMKLKVTHQPPPPLPAGYQSYYGQQPGFQPVAAGKSAAMAQPSVWDPWAWLRAEQQQWEREEDGA